MVEEFREPRTPVQTLQDATGTVEIAAPAHAAKLRPSLRTDEMAVERLIGRRTPGVDVEHGRRP